MDVEQIIAALGTAERGDLDAALQHCVTRGNELAEAELTEDNVAALEQLNTAAGQIRGEIERRDALAQRREAARGGALADTPDGSSHPGADGGDVADAGQGEGSGAGEGDPQGGDGDDGAAGEGDADGEGDGDGDDPDGDGDGGADGADGQDGVTAGGTRRGGRRQSMNGRQQGRQPDRPATPRVTATTRVQGGVPGFEVGAQLDRAALNAALSERFNTIRNVGSDGRVHVARTEFTYPAERQLTETDWQTNVERIESAIGPDAQRAARALVAAAGDSGGLCAPLETIYDIPTIGDTARPVRDTLTRFGVARGGIQYRKPFDALAMTEGLGTWTMDDDIAAGAEDYDGDPSKTCYEAVCPGIDDAIVYSTYLCLTFPNVSARFDREWVDATTRSAGVSHARYCENLLLAQLAAGSKLVHAPTEVSAVRDVLVNLDKIAAWYRSRYRLGAMDMLRWIAPAWLREIMRADLCRGRTDDLAALSIADSQIEAWFRARHVNVTWHLDGLAGATVSGQTIPQQFYGNIAAGDAIPPFIDKIDAILYPEGEWLFLDGGTLDLGLVRDSQLNKRNRYQQFTETWEGTAFRGLESLRTVFQVKPTGAAVGTIAPIGLTEPAPTV